MYDFNYHRPTSLTEALKLYDDADDGFYLSGGHSLLPSMKQRLLAPTDLIDLSGIDEMRGIEHKDGMLRIGASTLHDDVANSAIVRNLIPALSDLAGCIGDAQVRNRGTMGGSIANNDPAADYPSALLALAAQVETDRRTIDADDFFQGMFETALEDGEILTSIKYSIPESAAYVKHPNPASRYATVGVFIAKASTGVRVAITGAEPFVFRASNMEEALNQNFSTSALDEIILPAENMNSDLHASADYRAHLCIVMARRAIAKLM